MKIQFLLTALLLGLVTSACKTDPAPSTSPAPAAAPTSETATKDRQAPDELFGELFRRVQMERVYTNVNKMVEKYNVEDITLQAGGGEYPVQDGFGWSNGVYLRMAAEE